MPFPLRRLSFSLALLLLTGGLLTRCSSPSTPAQPGGAAAEVPARPAFPFGGPVDSLNGIAGHAFGEPLRAFSRLQRVPPTPGAPAVLTQMYTYEGTAGWFGKHRAQVPTQLYYFFDDKFCAFSAFGDPAALRPEAAYLLGRSFGQDPNQLFWEGARARAVYSEKVRGLGREGRLDVVSKPLEAAQAARARALLQAENTP